MAKSNSTQTEVPQGAVTAHAPKGELYAILNQKMLPGMSAVHLILRHLYDYNNEADNARLASALQLGYDALDEAYDQLDALDARLSTEVQPTPLAADGNEEIADPQSDNFSQLSEEMWHQLTTLRCALVTLGSVQDCDPDDGETFSQAVSVVRRTWPWLEQLHHDMEGWHLKRRHPLKKESAVRS